MRFVVTGSHGLIGRELVARLTSDGHDVLRLVRPTSVGESRPVGRPQSESSEGGPAGDVRDVPWDPAQGESDGHLLCASGPIDGAIHLAGAPLFDRRWSQEYRSEIYDSRVASGALLANVLSKLDPVPSVLITGSGISAYGDRGNEEITESSATGPGFLADVCRAWEQVTEPASEAGIRTVSLRTGIVLTTKGGALRKQLPMFRLCLGGRMATGKQYVSWISLEDEIGAIIHCLSTPGTRGPVNATAPNPVTNSEFAATLGKALGRPALLPAPAAALRLAFGRDRTDEVLLAGQRVYPSKLMSTGFTFGSPVLADLLQRLLAQSAPTASPIHTENEA
jgi:uncharacterized protein